MCSYMYKRVVTAKMAEYILEATHSAPSIIIVIEPIELAIKPSHTKVVAQSVEP